MIVAILADVRNGVPAGIVSARFHNTLADVIVAMATRVGEPRVVLTGGCFQNRALTERAIAALQRRRLQALLAPARPAQRRRTLAWPDRRGD